MRRLTFLLVALAVPAILVLGACGGDGGSPAATAAKSTAFPPSSDPGKNVPVEQRNQINVVIAGSDFFVGKNNFVFGITDKKDNPQGGAKAKATFYDLRDPANPKPVFTVDATASAPGVGPIVTVTHADGQTHTHGGQDEGRVGYYAPVTFDHAGGWGIVVQAELKDGTKGTSSVGFDVSAKPAILAPGMAAKKSDNLTKKDVTDIKEIDSGTPPNDMHDVKIKDSIAAGRPVVVVFSTPAFCTSRFCGPVNEEVESLQKDYKDRVDFVHIEIWKNFDKKQLNETATEWLIRADGGLSEPYVYVIDSKGTIYDRWEGPVARNIMEPAVKAVAEGKTYAK
ncbi:MAG: thioredoxin fold domain-containing protein [Anaerolineaceae bacterium]